MASFVEVSKLSDRFSQALQFAFQAHQFQIRKKGEVPYVSHLMAVAGLVLEAGGSEDEAIAALLHDAVEDAKISLDSIAEKFGYEISYIVGNLTERKETPKAERKSEYVWYVNESDASVKLVSAADKLHNLRSYASDGRELWSDDKAEFYAQLMPIYEGCDRVPPHWIAEMKQMLANLSDEIVCISKTEYESLKYWADQGHDWDREFGSSSEDPGDHPFKPGTILNNADGSQLIVNEDGTMSDYRLCQCGSGIQWTDCPESSQYCG